MRLQKAYSSFLANLWKRPDSQLLRYLLPFAGIGLALLIQASISWMLPKGTDFPYAFFYLIAIFGVAWFGGYGPGTVACLLTMVGLPLAVIHPFRLGAWIQAG